MNRNLEPFDSRSQAGQDKLVWELLGGPDRGTFLDIGASHPSERSNTFALEKQGWTGILVENDEYCVGLLKALRGGKVIAEDATKVDWRETLKGRSHIDYLSLDVDLASLDVLKSVLESGARFRVITAEHDGYRFGMERRDEMVELLNKNDYAVLCADVCDQGLTFEIWAVDKNGGLNVPPRFIRPTPTDWKEFFA